MELHVMRCVVTGHFHLSCHFSFSKTVSFFIEDLPHTISVFKTLSQVLTLLWPWRTLEKKLSSHRMCVSKLNWGSRNTSNTFITESFDMICNGTPLQYSCLENPMDGGAWWAAVHGVPRSRTRLSDFTFTFHFHALEKKMATHSSILAWRILGTGETGGLPSMGSHGVGHD